MKREVKKERNRRNILEAAVKVFAREGFHQARISDIAALAGVGHGTVYLYFPSKDAILLSIFEELMGEALDDLREAASRGKDAVEKLRLFVDAQLRIVEENRELTELVLIETRRTSKSLDGGTLAQVDAYIDFIATILREGIHEGLFRPDLDVSAVATCLFVGIEGVLTRWLLEKQGLRPRQQIVAILDTLLDGMRPRDGCETAQHGQWPPPICRQVGA